MSKLAYSYLRFSTPEQAGGDSRRRQHELARAYAARHGLVLDAGLSFRDLGMSAFHGRNAREGALRAFLDAVELGLVPRGSHLLVESLDRLSRDRVLAAQSLFLRIVEAGVTIVTLIDERSYSAESLNRSPMDLIVSLVCMMRANEESATKSARVRAAWVAKRAQLATKPATGRCPGWLRLDRAAGRFVERGREADVVRRIYAEAAAGLGQYAIARKLNAEAVPTFSRGDQRGRAWGPKYVRSLLTSPAVRGTYIPCITERNEQGRLLLRPQPPVEGYYPAVVDPAACNVVAQAQEARRQAFPGARHGRQSRVPWQAGAGRAGRQHAGRPGPLPPVRQHDAAAARRGGPVGLAVPRVQPRLRGCSVRAPPHPLWRHRGRVDHRRRGHHWRLPDAAPQSRRTEAALGRGAVATGRTAIQAHEAGGGRPGAARAQDTGPVRHRGSGCQDGGPGRGTAAHAARFDRLDRRAAARPVGPARDGGPG